MTEFYDAATWQNIPPGSWAALARDGRFAVEPAAVERRFERVRYITVLGGKAAAAYAGIADYEDGDAAKSVPGALREWAAERREMNCLARGYADRSDLPEMHRLIGDLPNVRYWVSTLDDKQWTVEELVADILAVEGLKLDPALIWGIQIEGGPTAPFDRSLLTAAW